MMVPRIMIPNYMLPALCIVFHAQMPLIDTNFGYHR
jgi:hypothetical protein